jgi:inhibitor of cysteine peptidase
MKTSLLFSVVLLAFAVTAADQDAKTITVTAGQTFIVTAGQTFNVTLASNPTTGYSWALAKPLDAKLLTLVTNIYQRPETRLVGAGGQEVWTFKADGGEGRTDIALKYVRPWETNIPPVQTTNFVVVISAPKPAK